VQDVHDPEENLEGAAKYLSSLIKRYDGDLRLASRVQRGEKAVERYGGVPNYAETKRYVSKVLGRAGLPDRARQPKPGEPEPVRVVRQSNASSFSPTPTTDSRGVRERRRLLPAPSGTVTGDLPVALHAPQSIATIGRHGHLM